MLNERTIVGHMLRVLRARGAYVEKFHGTQYTRAGQPDLIGCYRGMFFAIEVKRGPREALHNVTPRQTAALHEIRQAGGLAVVLYDPAQVDDLLSTLDVKADRWQQLNTP